MTAAEGLQRRANAEKAGRRWKAARVGFALSLQGRVAADFMSAFDDLPVVREAVWLYDGRVPVRAKVPKSPEIVWYRRLRGPAGCCRERTARVLLCLLRIGRFTGRIQQRHDEHRDSRGSHRSGRNEIPRGQAGGRRGCFGRPLVVGPELEMPATTLRSPLQTGDQE